MLCISLSLYNELLYFSHKRNIFSTRIIHDICKCTIVMDNLYIPKMLCRVLRNGLEKEMPYTIVGYHPPFQHN